MPFSRAGHANRYIDSACSSFGVQNTDVTPLQSQPIAMARSSHLSINPVNPLKHFHKKIKLKTRLFETVTYMNPSEGPDEP